MSTVLSDTFDGDEPTAAQLAARIEIPRRLPPRLSDGQPLQHLSHSSYSRWVLCPDSWRRYYLCAERSAPTGAMFLGRQVDDAVTLYYRRILEHGEHLSLDQVRDAYWDGWKAAAEAERAQLGISCEDDLREDRAFKLGLDAIELTFKQLVPRLGEPVAVQRRVEYTLGGGPGMERALLPGPRNRAAGRRGQRGGARRRLQGQDDAAEPAQGRP